jgi:hypothetical protein
MDYFHWNFFLGLVIVTIVLVLGLQQKPPSVRLNSLPLAVLLVLVSVQMLITGILARIHWTQPFRISSVLAGETIRPGIFVIIEDVMAVDGGGGTAYRFALMARYKASPCFRQLLSKLNWFWGLGGFILAIALFGIIIAIDNENIAFGIG